MTDTQGFFQQALDFTLAKEGGFVNDPADSGGATNMGITGTTLAAWRESVVSVSDVENLSRSEAAAIYFDKYWQPLSLSFVTQIQPAIAVFDATVLFGPGVSSLYAQQALVNCGFFSLAVDGHIGSNTLSALGGVKAGSFLNEFSLLLTKRIADIVRAHPADEKFRGGWENRVKTYTSLV